MKRRKALMTLGALGGLSIFSFTGYKWLRWNRSPDLDYLKSKKKMIATLVDLIIPATDSPGALQANVHIFIYKMIKECADVRTQNIFIDGIKDLEDQSYSLYDKSFSDCSLELQVEMLRRVEKEDKPFPGIIGRAQHKFIGKSFFATLKEYCTIGYFTSMEGATQGLRYLYIPGKYNACESYSEDEKSWATA